MRAYVTAAALTYRSGDKQVFRKGEQVDLPKDVVARFVELGMVSKTRAGGKPAKQDAQAAESKPTEPDTNTGEDVDAEENDTDDDADPLDDVDATDDRPARAASIDEWRTYAEANGLATKGMSKQDIIAAIG